MERRVIVSDLTRFANKDIVCTAVIDLDTGECLRPLPYFPIINCKEWNIQPGAILEGFITLDSEATSPHQEDAKYKGKLTFKGPSTAEIFKKILTDSLANSVAEGFGVEFEVGQKHIPQGMEPDLSIITIEVDPCDIKIFEDNFKPGKIKLSFKDKSGHQFNYVPITDLGFYDYAMLHQKDGKLQEVQNFLRNQDEIFLRIGVARYFEQPNSDNTGYWLQANGIYTFPSFLEEIRCYK